MKSTAIATACQVRNDRPRAPAPCDVGGGSSRHPGGGGRHPAGRPLIKVAARFLSRLWDFGNAPTFYRYQLVTPGARWPSWGIAGGDFAGLVAVLEEIADGGPRTVYWCGASFLAVGDRKVRRWGAENAVKLGAVVLDVDEGPLADALRRLEAIGIEPHTIVQTSPGRHQLALMVRQTRLGRGNRAAELDRRRRLVRQLASIVGADPHAATALHRFRLPGLPRRLADGSTFTPFIVSTSNHAPYTTGELFRAIDAGEKGRQATPVDMRTSGTSTSLDVEVGEATAGRVRAIAEPETAKARERMVAGKPTPTSADVRVSASDRRGRGSAGRVAKSLGIGSATVGRVLSTGALRRLRFGHVGHGHRNAAAVALAYACARDGLTESQALTLISAAVARWEHGGQYDPAALRASVRSCYSHPRGLVAERLLAILDADGQPIITPHEARLACLAMRHPRPLRPASELVNVPAAVRSVDVLRVLAELQRATRDHQGRRRRRGAPVLIDARSLAELSGVPLGSVQGAIIPAFRRAGVYRVTRRGRSSVGSFALQSLTQATPQAGGKAYCAQFVEWAGGRGAAAVAAPWFAARFGALIAPVVAVLLVAAALRSSGLLSESAGPQAVPVEGARNRPTSRGPPGSGRAALVGTTKDGADGRGVCPGRDAR